jgi:hypothetical protein
VKRQFQNLNLQCWEHPQRLGDSQPCLCLQGDALASDLILEAINELKADGPPAKRTLTLRPNGRANPIDTIRIAFFTESNDLRQMSLTRDGTVAILEFTVKGLEKFRRAVDLWRNGSEDFSIHPEGSRKAKHLKKRDEMGSKDLASGEPWFWTSRMEP